MQSDWGGRRTYASAVSGERAPPPALSVHPRSYRAALAPPLPAQPVPQPAPPPPLPPPHPAQPVLQPILQPVLQPAPLPVPQSVPPPVPQPLPPPPPPHALHAQRVPQGFRPAPPPLPWTMDDATLPGVPGAPALGAGVATSDFLWDKLQRLPPRARTAHLTRPPVATLIPTVHTTTGLAPVQFGKVDLAAAAFGGASRSVTVVNAGVVPVRITDVALRPVGVPFRAADPPVGAVIAPGMHIEVGVVVDRLAGRASVIDAVPDGDDLQFWCIIGVDCTSLQIHGGIQLITMGCCIGAEFRADIVSWREATAAVRLDVSAKPFFPKQFKKCFELADAALFTIWDDKGADALIPPGMRRVVERMGVFLNCPSRARRARGRLLSNGLPKGEGEEGTGGADNPVTIENDISIGNGYAADFTEIEDVVVENELPEDDSTVPEGESMKEYRHRMILGLFFEAEQMFTDIKRYDIIETPMQPVVGNPLRVCVNVQGISESRPALVLFDPVRLRPTHPTLYKTTEVIARVVHINTKIATVTLKLPDECKKNKTLYGILQRAQDGSGKPLKCHVRFCVGNHFLANTRMLRVVQKLDASLYSRLKQTPPPVHPIAMFNRPDRATSTLRDIQGAEAVLSELNARQLEAVFLCVGTEEEDVDSRWPVCVFGPPGTGKTRTVTAAICVALLKYGRRTKILATAPSHQAADVLCERLVKAIAHLGDLGDGSGPATLLRLNPYERPVNTARVGTMRHTCQYGPTGFFDLPPVDKLAAFNIIVSTCTSADLLSELPSNHFWTGVFCDESAQSLQPEALIPLNRFACDPDVRIVLAGDPHQLNADVRSKSASRLGLNLSLMEALMRARDRLCRPVAYNVHLRVNYRVRHPVLLDLPNQMFYDGRLIPCPDRPTEVVPEMRDLFPTGLPLMFAGVGWPEERVSERSPGLINVGEAEHIRGLCERMTGAGNGESGLVHASDITVICPYRAQVFAVRRSLRQAGLDGVKVGTVFDTQGQENRVVFISLTVSTAKSLAAEESRHDGISSAKKFNVAVTRAIELLVVVGNPAVVVENAYWGALLRYAVDKKCYKSGIRFPVIDKIAEGGPDGDRGGACGENKLFPLQYGGNSNRAVQTVDYAPIMEELDNSGEYEQEDYDEDMQQANAAFRGDEDMPWRVMM